MSAENISYDLKRFAGIKRDYTPEEVENLEVQLRLNILCVNSNQLNYGNFLIQKIMLIL